MAVESGVAGMLNLGGTPQSSTGPDLLRIIQAVGQIKQQKQDMAKSSLDTMLTMMDKYGIPPDEKVFNKTMEEAGIPTAALQTLSGMKPQDVTKMGKDLQTGGGAAPGNDVNQAVPAGTGTVEKGVAAANKSPFQSMVERAQQRVQSTATTQNQQEVLNQHILGLKERAASGDLTAVGQLMNVGGIPFNLEQNEWNKMTEPQRSAMVDVASGAESGAQKELRLSNQAAQLWGSGRFDSLSDARAFAEGKAGVNLKPDLTRMGEEAKFANEMIQMGLDGDQAKEVGKKMANGVSLADALPAGVSPIVQQQLGLQRRQVAAQETQAQAALTGAGAEVARVGLEKERVKKEAEAAASNMLFKLKELDDKSFNERFDNMVEMIRNKAKVPEDMQQNMLNELATRSGMLPTEVESAWNYLGYKTFQYKPLVNSKEQDLVNQGAGAGQKLNATPPPKPGPSNTPTGKTGFDVLNEKISGALPAGMLNLPKAVNEALKPSNIEAAAKNLGGSIWNKVKNGLTLTEAEKQRIADEQKKGGHQVGR